MAFRTSCAALLLSSLLTAGCGTAANLVKSAPDGDGRSPFGGVRHDECCIKKAAAGEYDLGICPRSGSDHHPQVAVMLLCAADVPFSLIGDVLTWPYTAAYTFINQPIPTPPVLQATTEVQLYPILPAVPTKPAERPKEKSDAPSKPEERPKEKPDFPSKPEERPGTKGATLREDSPPPNPSPAILNPPSATNWRMDDGLR